VDETIFFDTDSKVAVYEDSLKIIIKTIGNKKQLLFVDEKGNGFSKMIE